MLSIGNLATQKSILYKRFHFVNLLYHSIPVRY